jgi:hypothetical protein
LKQHCQLGPAGLHSENVLKKKKKKEKATKKPKKPKTTKALTLKHIHF